MEASSKQQNIYPNIPNAPIAILTIAGRANMPEPITPFTMESVSPGTPTTRFKPSSALAVDMVVISKVNHDIFMGKFNKTKRSNNSTTHISCSTIIKIIISKYTFEEQNFL